MNKKLLSTIFIVLVLMVSSCSHKKVLVNKLHDEEMTCDEIRLESKNTEGLLKSIHSKTGLSGRNVGMFLLFWPGIIVNEMSADKAEDLANERLQVLKSLYKKRNCDKTKE